MSFQVGSACYDTATQAAQASASSHVGAVVVLGPTAYEVDVSASSDTSITYVLNPIGGGTSVTSVTSYTAQPCNLMTVDDGLQLSWLVVGAWAAAFACVLIVRTLRGMLHGGDNYGNA